MSIHHRVFARYLSSYSAEEIAQEFGLSVGRTQFIILSVRIELQEVCNELR